MLWLSAESSGLRRPLEGFTMFEYAFLAIACLCCPALLVLLTGMAIAGVFLYGLDGVIVAVHDWIGYEVRHG